MTYATVDDLYRAIVKRLAEAGYARAYDNESDFEEVVWRRLLPVLGADAQQRCLTSHTARTGRSPAAFDAFRNNRRGPDVKVLGSNNRLDIVVLHDAGSIGIEVKLLGKRGHTGKLTQGLGQAMLGLEHRDRTLLVIHCGTVSQKQRRELQQVAGRICSGTRTAMVVVP